MEELERVFADINLIKLKEIWQKEVDVPVAINIFGAERQNHPMYREIEDGERYDTYAQNLFRRYIWSKIVHPKDRLFFHSCQNSKKEEIEHWLNLSKEIEDILHFGDNQFNKDLLYNNYYDLLRTHLCCSLIAKEKASVVTGNIWPSELISEITQKQKEFNKDYLPLGLWKDLVLEFMGLEHTKEIRKITSEEKTIGLMINESDILDNATKKGVVVDVKLQLVQLGGQDFYPVTHLAFVLYNGVFHEAINNVKEYVKTQFNGDKPAWSSDMDVRWEVDCEDFQKNFIPWWTGNSLGAALTMAAIKLVANKNFVRYVQ